MMSENESSTAEMDHGLNHLSSSQELLLSQMSRSSNRQSEKCKLLDKIILTPSNSLKGKCD